MYSSSTQKPSTREIAELSILCAMMVAGKEMMRLIPNVHPVTVIVLLTVILYGSKAFYSVLGFVILEIFIYGFGLWTAMYLYVWPLLVVIAIPFQHNRNWLLWAGIAGIYGLCFGALCSIPYIFLSGLKGALSFWITGIPFDIIHGISNFVTVLLLLPILVKLVSRVHISN